MIPFTNRDTMGKTKLEKRRASEWSYYLQEGTTVQTLILSKDRFGTAGEAKRWVRTHKFKAKKIDETESSYRFRQRDPSEFRRGSFRTIEIAEGVKAVIGRLKDVQAKETISYLGDVGDILLKEGSTTGNSWVQVFTLGKFQHPQGEFNVDDGFLKNIVSSFQYMTNRGAEVPVDYEHGSAIPGATPEAARAAGWVTEIDHRPGEGLWANVSWTDDAIDFIRSREYRFISPEFHPDYTDELGKDLGPTLLAVGLVNRPHLKGMEAVSLKERHMSESVIEEVVVETAEEVVVEEPIEVELSSDASSETVKAGYESDMEMLHNRLDEIARVVADLVGDVDREKSKEEDEVMAEYEEPKMKEQALPEEVTTLLAEMNARLQRVEAENKELKAERDAVAAKADLDLAFRQGRITRAQVEPLMSLRLKDKAAFDAIVAATPEGTVASSETEIGVCGDAAPEASGDLIETIRSRANDAGISFSKAWKQVSKEEPELVAEHMRKTRNTNGHVGRILGGQ